MLDTKSIRFRVALLVSAAITLSLGGFALFLDAEIRAVNEREETAKLQNTNQLVLNLVAQTDAILRQQADGWAHTFVTALAGDYTLEQGETPVLKLNGTPLNGSTREVDAFTSSSDGNVATVFARQGDDFVRVATSLKKEDGQRAVGTKLGKDHPAYATVMAGKTFTGKATLFGRPYMTQYEPIKDAKGDLVGLHFIGINILSSLNFMKETIAKVKLGESGYVYVLDASAGPAAGTLLIHPSSEGKNIIDAKDSDGRSFIREILEKRNGSIIYPWLNAGEKKPREKIVVFNEYKSWQWIVASGSYTEEIFSLAAHARNIMIGATFFLTALLLAILVYYLNRIVLQPLRELVAHSRRIADGDLTIRIENTRQDEVGHVLGAMQQMVGKLREIIGQVSGAAGGISDTAQSLATTTHEISIAAESQSKASASAAASLEEVSASITEVSSLAVETETSSRQTVNLTDQSVKSVHQAVADIGAMASAVRASAEEVGVLRRRSEEVGGIAGVIREIADQTNLLALNAAIEAARAGESGRGFAVVADEVRKLAERTASATQEIASVVGQIQQRTQETVAGMEAVVPQIESGLKQVGEVATMLEGIAGEAQRSMARAVDVAGATREQAAAAADISRNVEQIAQMTEETNANMRGSADGAQRLEQMAVELRQQVAYFRVA